MQQMELVGNGPVNQNVKFHIPPGTPLGNRS